MTNNINRPEYVIIHHSNVDTRYSHFPAIENYHRSKGFPKSSLGFYCGYHLVLDKMGRIVRARADSDIGAHTIGWNKKSIAVALQGNFDKGVPTPLQLVALRGIIREYALPYMFHKEAQENRTCAGFYFTKDMIGDTYLDIYKISLEDEKKKEELLQRIGYLKKLIWEMKAKLSSYKK